MKTRPLGVSLRFLLIPAALLGSAVLLAGCDARILSFLTPQPTSPLPAGTAQPLASPTTGATNAAAQPTARATESQTPVDGSQTLTIWVPPQFDPNSGTAAGSLFKARLESFSSQNPGVTINVRVKATSGPAGLLESLAATSAAAPKALPSLIALPRQDLETAALKGLIFPLDGLTDFKDDHDWYNYARDMAMIQNSTFGLPFGGDALLLMYRPEKVSSAPVSWSKLLSYGTPVVFAADDSQAMVSLALYQSAGGSIQDAQHRPVLQSTVLSQVLRLYADGAGQGSFPLWLTQYDTDGQAWQAYRDRRADLVIGWSSRYLSELPADTNAVGLPSLGSTNFTLATGWLWAMPDPAPGRQALSMRLAQYLSETDYMAAWTAASGLLPTRPSALAAWPSQSLKSILSPIAFSAQGSPTNDLTASLGPVLRDATLQVLKNQTDPVQAAEAAAERLNKP